MQNIDWFADLHAHKWEKNKDSIMNPGTKITWPQLVAEFVIYWRCQFLKDYKDIKKGPDWYKTIMKSIRALNQQSATICNYFLHPIDEPLVEAAFKNYFRKHKPLKIGQFRKTRWTIKGNRQVSNITQDEKDIVIGIKAELERLISQRNAFVTSMPKITENKPIEQIKFSSLNKNSKNKLDKILELEKKLNIHKE